MILKQVPDENVYYYFEDMCELDAYCGERKIIITGNDDFKSFGDSTLLKVANGDYWWNDEDGYGDYVEPEEALERYTGKKWERYTMTGYSQSEWQYIYYEVDSITEDMLEEIDNFYMNKVKEYRDEDNCSWFVPDDVAWKGKEAICDYLGFDSKDTEILEVSGQHIAYDYQTI